MSPERRVDLLVRLVEASAVERLPEAETELLLGCPVRLLSVAADNPHAAMHGGAGRAGAAAIRLIGSERGACRTAAKWPGSAQIWACQRAGVDKIALPPTGEPGPVSLARAMSGHRVPVNGR